jgi:hypothetical protein
LEIVLGRLRKVCDRMCGLFCLFFIGVIFQLTWPENALAWGPGVHTMIGLSSLNEVSLLLPSIARMITSFPLEYLYGSLAADFFIGKSRRRKRGNPHNWEGGFRFLREASDDREASYAFGFLSHLAADVVAHNLFVPNLTNAYPGKRRMGHLYWEIKADYWVGPWYTRVAKDVLSTDHRTCDELLTMIEGRRGNGLKAKKHLFAQSVRLSDYIYSTQNLLFSGKAVRLEMFQKNLALMVDLSCRVAKDFLTHPESSPCLLYNPVGRRGACLTTRKRFSVNMPYAHPLTRRFTVDPENLRP